ncbi:Carbon monoxide dehydrogenase small chain [Pelotomaculum schinkii]|uniref:Carbon monoxide dehydrogenase small chain n=1 Tax=Pelotomaculum schinkii TaxID=78350 RepID=A0A4Y7RBM0_9FIRM|nr:MULTISPECIES: (2Fe-2S)-binding protein [Pelotomaculum]TEB06111.1 Carbon monoxide dehydrogenase small chain [Pelotomaculum schinkii]TEB13042.1 Carbon monoxide dehydrogenase small chain [Pelotomaculum sp. FP]
MSEILNLYVNGTKMQAIAKPESTLLEVLRDELHLVSPKCGCNHGDCGACTVILDGKAVKSCTVLALTAEGKKVVTVEGLSNGSELHPVQQAFIKYGAPQCGYCTPGMVMATVAFLLDNPTPKEEEIKDALSGNLCRCGGYKEYVKAVSAVVSGEFGRLPEGSEINA